MWIWKWTIIGWDYILDWLLCCAWIDEDKIKCLTWWRAKTEAHTAFGFQTLFELLWLHCWHGAYMTWCIKVMLRNTVWRRQEKEVMWSLKSSRLRERNLGSGQKGRRSGKWEHQRRENQDNASVCVLFVTVAFQRTVALCACVCPSVFLCAY